MKKWILIGACAVVIIVIVIVVLAVSNLGPIIKSAVNTYGPEITKTQVRLGDVDISLFSARAELKDFLLGNPKGFKSPQAMKVRSIYANVDKKSLAGNTIVIDRIEVVGPDITYEKESGTDNFQTILNNVKKSVDKGTPSEEGTAKSEKQEGGKKLLIRDFIVREGKVNLAVSTPLGEKTVSASLPDIHLKDLGKKGGGASPGKIFEEVIASLHEKITSPVVTDMLNKELKAMGTSLEAVSGTAKKQLETLKAGGQKGVGPIGEKLKGLLGQ